MKITKKRGQFVNSWRISVKQVVIFLIAGATFLQVLVMRLQHASAAPAAAASSKPEVISKKMVFVTHKDGKSIPPKPRKNVVKPDDVAYMITVSSCSENSTLVLDGAAVLGHSIRLSHHQSRYGYQLYAFLHPTAHVCKRPLSLLGYEVVVRESPIPIDQIQNPKYAQYIEEKGCCGSKEFMKLYAYKLEAHKVAVHLDTDTLILQPTDELFDAILGRRNASSPPLALMRPDEGLPDKVDFFYTRDYLQQSHLHKDPSKYAVQGGFFIVRPNSTRFEEIVKVVLKGDYHDRLGWGSKQYGGFWGSAQIQGLLSYFYGEFHPEGAVELNRCIYNNMVDDPYDKKGKCRTGQDLCEDCRKTPLSEMKTVHITMCLKPWTCPRLREATFPEVCKEVHKKWFEIRQSLEKSWGIEAPTDGWYFERTLGYCTKKGGFKIRYYLPIQIPSNLPAATG